jgi:hypothetical protein
MRLVPFWAPFWLFAGLLGAQQRPTGIGDAAEDISTRWLEREQQFYVLLANPLKAQLPRLSAILAMDPPLFSDAEALRDHIRMVLDISPKNHVLPAPALLLLADRLATLYGSAWDPHLPMIDRNFTAGPYSFIFHYDPLGATWVYDHALARQVYRDSSSTPAGEWAFLTLEKLGWNTGVGCAGDPATFRSVIAESDRFFNRHQTSAYRLDFLFDLAQAYETWWSLSQASSDDDYVVAANFTAGADRARERAIELYRQIVQETPKSDFAAYATVVLPLLQSKLDTMQRQYYCIYD